MKVGVVGLGAMDSAKAVNLHKAGMLTSLWNRTPGRTALVTEETSNGQAIKAVTEARRGTGF